MVKRAQRRDVEKEWFRGVAWSRKGEKPVRDKDGARVHRYVVVGILVTDVPLVELDSQPRNNRSMLDGPVTGLAAALTACRQRQARYRLGGANDVLVSLDTLLDDEDDG